ncbi:HDOD domain-containing protein, partial [Burkholderia cenocepacia]
DGVDVRGVGCDEIGLEVAARWRRPDGIRAGMAGDDHAAHAGAFDDEDDDARHAGPAADDGPAERIRWLRAVRRCSTDVAGALVMPASPQRDARSAAPERHYGGELDMGTEAAGESGERRAGGGGSGTRRRGSGRAQWEAEEDARRKGGNGAR